MKGVVRDFGGAAKASTSSHSSRLAKRTTPSRSFSAECLSSLVRHQVTSLQGLRVIIAHLSRASSHALSLLV